MLRIIVLLICLFQNQLRSFVSSLTKEVKLLYGVTCPKPVWWPEDLVWATPDLKPHKHVHGQVMTAHIPLVASDSFMYVHVLRLSVLFLCRL